MNTLIPKIAAGVTAGAFLFSTAAAAEIQPQRTAPAAAERPTPTAAAAAESSAVAFDPDETTTLVGGNSAAAVGVSGFGGAQSGPRISFNRNQARSESESEGPMTYLGIAAEVVSEELAAHLPLESGVGLVVRSVAPESPAATAGIQLNDVLSKIDDQVLVHPRQLQVLVRSKKEGDTLSLTYLRKGETKSVNATLVKRDASSSNLANGVQSGYRLNQIIKRAIDGEVAGMGGIGGAPLFHKQTVIVGPDGKVTRVDAGPEIEKLRGEIERQLKDKGIDPEVVKKVEDTLRQAEERVRKSVAVVEKKVKEAAEKAEKAEAKKP